LLQDLQDFAASSGKDGFIYFSMGSVLKGSKMPESHRLALLKAFSRIRQKVLWKWETETMPDLPPNVKLVKWAPQQDILGHPKMKAFITHGGMGSTSETVYHGVPFVGIPIFGDQLANVEKFMRMGVATQLDFVTLNEDSIVTAIETVVNDPK
jgi:glucuronosyltransferase